MQARTSVQTVYNDEGGSSSAPAEKKGSVVGRVVVGALQDAGWGIAKSMIDVYFPIVPIYEFASGPKKYVGGYVTAFENATGQNGGEEVARFWPAQGIAVAATYGAVKVAGMRGPVAASADGLGAQDALYKDAVQQYNATSDFSKAGRALTKHPEVVGETSSTLRKTFRTEGAINEAAHNALKGIIRNGYQTTPTLGRYGQVVQYQIPNGFGARWYATGEFIGFINP